MLVVSGEFLSRLKTYEFEELGMEEDPNRVVEQYDLIGGIGWEERQMPKPLASWDRGVKPNKRSPALAHLKDKKTSSSKPGQRRSFSTSLPWSSQSSTAPSDAQPAPQIPYTEEEAVHPSSTLDPGTPITDPYSARDKFDPELDALLAPNRASLRSDEYFEVDGIDISKLAMETNTEWQKRTILELFAVHDKTPREIQEMLNPMYDDFAFVWNLAFLGTLAIERNIDALHLCASFLSDYAFTCHSLKPKKMRPLDQDKDIINFLLRRAKEDLALLKKLKKAYKMVSLGRARFNVNETRRVTLGEVAAEFFSKNDDPESEWEMSDLVMALK